jgi:hypothetical protein
VNISLKHSSYENSLDVGAASFMAFGCYLIGTLISNKFDKHRHFAKFSLLCGLVVRVPGYRAEKYRVSCEVRTEFIYVT